MKKTLALLLCAMLVLALVPVVALPASAAGDKTVVYLKDGGTGDGSTAENAVGKLTDAFNALDLTKDCTVVICGTFTQVGHFDYKTDYAGSVTITSKYNGTDYAASGAQFVVPAARYFCYGDTTFEDITIKMTGSYYLVVGQDHHVVVGENVTIIPASGTTGAAFGSAFDILSGYQGDQKVTADAPNAVTAGNAKVEVYSGEKILIGAGNRQVAGTVRTGTVDITIGGTAKVDTLYICSVNFADLKDGDITVTVKDNATVAKLGSALNANNVVNSFTLNWLGGSIGNAKLTNGFNIANPPSGVTADDVMTTYTNGTKLNSNATTQAAANYAEISALFGGAASAEPAKVEVPARPTLTNTTDKSYIAFTAPATPAVTHVKNFGDASAALTSGGTIVVTQKALYSFKSPDAANTVDGTKGTVLVTAKEGDTSYINIETDSKETGIILGNNGFIPDNYNKVDYLLLAGDVILDDVVLFNRAHNNVGATMAEPNSVRALAGSKVVLGSGVQFAHRQGTYAFGEQKVTLDLPNMALDTEEGAVVFIDALGFSKYTGKGILVINKDLVDKVTANDFAGFEGKVVDEEGNPLFAAAPQNPTPATGSMTVVIAAGAILASLGAVVALKKREER